MKAILLIALGLLDFMWSSSLHAESLLLPGIAYYEGKESLVGTLIFQLSPNHYRGTNSLDLTTVYKIDLTNGKLIEVTTAPKGLLIAADDGDCLCVVYNTGKSPNGVPYLRQNTNAFIYSVSLRTNRCLAFESRVQHARLTQGHAFFEVTTSNKTRIISYDIKRNQSNSVELAHASHWEYEHYDQSHLPRGNPEILHFQYSKAGKRVQDGTDYRTGFYSLNIFTKELRWFAEATADNDDTTFNSKAFDGRYVFFQGRDAPYHGTRLVSSVWPEMHLKDKDPGGKGVKLLTAFSKLSALSSGGYALLGMSPDGQFAFVEHSEASIGKSGMPRAMHKYYIVNVSSGKTRLLLKDDVQRSTGQFMSEVWWVR